jgi:hypothetical protein
MRPRGGRGSPDIKTVRSGVAYPRQEGHDLADQPHVRPGARGIAVPRLDRWSGPAPRRVHRPATLNSTSGAQRVVETQRGHREAIDGRGPDACGGLCRSATGQGRRPLESRLRRPGKHRGASRPGRGVAAEPTAKARFDILTSQNRDAVLYRIDAAQRADTRAGHIEQYVAMLATGRTIYRRSEREPLSVGPAQRRAGRSGSQRTITS